MASMARRSCADVTVTVGVPSAGCKSGTADEGTADWAVDEAVGDGGTAEAAVGDGGTAEVAAADAGTADATAGVPPPEPSGTTGVLAAADITDCQITFV